MRGHLYVESRLIQLIEDALPDPGAIDLSRLSFRIKLDLAVALKLISETNKLGYIQLNALRNQMAHNVDAEPTKIDEKRLYQALNEEQRKFADSLSHGIGILGTLKSSIAALCVEVLGLLLERRREAKKASQN
jgi:hypothetical protein